MLVVVAVVLGVLVVTVNVVDVVFVGHGLMTALRTMLVLGGCVLCVDFVFSHGVVLSRRRAAITCFAHPTIPINGLQCIYLIDNDYLLPPGARFQIQNGIDCVPGSVMCAVRAACPKTGSWSQGI